jgi:hypothetical protein
MLGLFLHLVEQMRVGDRIGGATSKLPLIEHGWTLRAQVYFLGQHRQYRGRRSIEVIAMIGQIANPTVAQVCSRQKRFSRFVYLSVHAR